MTVRAPSYGLCGMVGLTRCPFRRLERRSAVYRAQLWRLERGGGCLVSLRSSALGLPD